MYTDASAKFKIINTSHWQTWSDRKKSHQDWLTSQTSLFPSSSSSSLGCFLPLSTLYSGGEKKEETRSLSDVGPNSKTLTVDARVAKCKLFSKTQFQNFTVHPQPPIDLATTDASSSSCHCSCSALSGWKCWVRNEDRRCYGEIEEYLDFCKSWKMHRRRTLFVVSWSINYWCFHHVPWHFSRTEPKQNQDPHCDLCLRPLRKFRRFEFAFSFI